MSKKLTTGEFIQKAQTIHGNNFDYSKSVYIHSQTKIEIICLICDTCFWQKPNDHLNGSGCLTCKINNETKTNEMFVLDAYRVHGDLYIYDNVVYVNNEIKVKILCPVHGLFLQTPLSHIVNKSGCPKCKYLSKGEDIINKYLSNHNINFIEQYTHPTCVYKIRLRFDFYLPDYNLLIEYQGKQHFEFIPYWHKTIETFQEYNKRDNIKRQWAIYNKVNILEIGYQDYNNIENILTTNLC